jgi:hypothetical protein
MNTNEHKVCGGQALDYQRWGAAAREEVQPWWVGFLWRVLVLAVAVTCLLLMINVLEWVDF